MPTQEKIREKVEKTYASAKKHLKKVVKVDDPETKKAIKHFHKVLNLQSDLENCNDNDYQFACLSNEGLAKAYCQVTSGVNTGDVEYRKELANQQFRKIQSPLIKHSILCQSVFISETAEQDAEQTNKLINC
ncbi:hypothetical protein [Legionella jamestowniensis]|uniref:Uncharacterized protein n=1 Tax=Legionella jamestowniensis TaxID=455 RepID=A0A0W0ULH5_9GAMM|nr:hypothetical protein [Legionella jamestowniensis]KTD08623.1 hypothetical protein Ljam_2818 [Legionella jamestowniensis]SFL53742.1 hypothetical protein SAMN02746073_0768 [Legionella jamestowniensis DSM 19215]